MELPSEIWTLIFSFLEGIDRVHAAQICRRLRYIIWEEMDHININTFTILERIKKRDIIFFLYANINFVPYTHLIINTNNNVLFRILLVKCCYSTLALDEEYIFCQSSKIKKTWLKWSGFSRINRYIIAKAAARSNNFSLFKSLANVHNNTFLFKLLCISYKKRNLHFAHKLKQNLKVEMNSTLALSLGYGNYPFSHVESEFSILPGRRSDFLFYHRLGRVFGKHEQFENYDLLPFFRHKELLAKICCKKGRVDITSWLLNTNILSYSELTTYSHKAIIHCRYKLISFLFEKKILIRHDFRIPINMRTIKRFPKLMEVYIPHLTEIKNNYQLQKLFEVAVIMEHKETISILLHLVKCTPNILSKASYQIALQLIPFMKEFEISNAILQAYKSGNYAVIKAAETLKMNCNQPYFKFRRYCIDPPILNFKNEKEKKRKI
ncbi:MAG: F-box protein [Nitrososphaerota archaeon]